MFKKTTAVMEAFPCSGGSQTEESDRVKNQFTWRLEKLSTRTWLNDATGILNNMKMF